MPKLRTRSRIDRKSTRLNSSHVEMSYAVFCLKRRLPPSTLFPYTTLFRSAFSLAAVRFEEDGSGHLPVESRILDRVLSFGIQADGVGFFLAAERIPRRPLGCRSSGHDQE